MHKQLKLFILSIFLLPGLYKAQAQVITSLEEVQPYFYNLPLSASKEALLQEAKRQFPNNTIDSFKIIGNSKVYFEDTTVVYDYFHKRPIRATLRIFQYLPKANAFQNDTALHVQVSAFYGTGKKAKRHMYNTYSTLRDLLNGKFAQQSSACIFAARQVGSFTSFSMQDTMHAPRVVVCWDKDGSLPLCLASITFIQPSQER
ncbi:hypothetical protein [Deminuibacter soli]|uniref:Uncharacterized protein n=1 Tax=Deminuibacter soli TaxID=2291815 RepID=A0A3E1NHX4_9BACT|nr:hypothetical protein [Deminuibacter soli]RFM27502.1 hypothetical protein DXN05_15950 [Deminuibacter soli]